MSAQDIARVAVRRHGRTFAEDAGIRLADKPAPLFRLLVLSLLLSARISSDLALGAARELATWRSPRALQASTWQERVDALGRGGYRRYDESTARELGELADVVLERYRGDLRRMRGPGLDEALQQFTGIGPVGAAIFQREVQGVWEDVAPYVDGLAADGADKLGLPRDAHRLAALVPVPDLVRLVAACVRAARDDDVVVDVHAQLRPT